MLILICISVAFSQRQFAEVYVKYAGVILMMGINCEVLIDISCLDCGRELFLFLPHHIRGVYLKAESSNKNTEYMPGGQVKPIFDKKRTITSVDMCITGWSHLYNSR